MPQKRMFHTGEFARLVGVNKKTLHYYDAQGIFKPDSVAANGYRCYSSRQLITFYMIRSLREMGLSLEEIRSYLSARSPAGYAKLLGEQLEWLQKEIHRYTHMRHIVETQLQVLAMAEQVECGTVFVCGLPEARLVCSENVRMADEAQEDRIVTQHVKECLAAGLNAGYPIGAMVAAEDYLTPGQEGNISCYFTRTNRSLQSVRKAYRHLRPAGRYAATCFQGDYMDTRMAYERLRTWFSAQGIQPSGYAYEESMVEDMSASRPEDYITRIAVKI